MVTKAIWKLAISLLKDLNPEASEQELEAKVNRGFALSANPNEYLSDLMGI